MAYCWLCASYSQPASSFAGRRYEERKSSPRPPTSSLSPSIYFHRPSPSIEKGGLASKREGQAEPGGAIARGGGYGVEFRRRSRMHQSEKSPLFRFSPFHLLRSFSLSFFLLLRPPFVRPGFWACLYSSSLSLSLFSFRSSSSKGIDR